jgi:ABC-type Fe3+/spermidine/putrescine transport system ATPase subunit
MSDLILEIRGSTTCYGKQIAVNDVSLRIPKGAAIERYVH